MRCRQSLVTRVEQTGSRGKDAHWPPPSLQSRRISTRQFARDPGRQSTCPSAQMHRLIQPSSPGSELDGAHRGNSTGCSVSFQRRPAGLLCRRRPVTARCVIIRLIPSHPTFLDGSQRRLVPRFQNNASKQSTESRTMQKRGVDSGRPAARAAFPDSGRSGRGHRLNQPPSKLGMTGLSGFP
jgi:hypothetical protein